MMSETDPDEPGDQEPSSPGPTPRFSLEFDLNLNEHGHSGDQEPSSPGPSPRFSLEFDLNLNEHGPSVVFGVADHEYVVSFVVRYTWRTGTLVARPGNSRNCVTDNKTNNVFMISDPKKPPSKHVLLILGRIRRKISGMGLVTSVLGPQVHWGVTFKAHKLILAACSKHLADLFETAPLHQNLLVILDGTSASNMSALLEFMYKGEVHVSQDSLSSFLKAAECLQVKGLSIEHEKLAVAQSVTAMDTSTLESPRKHLKVLKEENMDNNGGGGGHHQSSPSPSYSPTVPSPYMQHPHHYNRYEQRMPTTGGSGAASAFEKRPLRSPNDLLLQESVRASVLRDGSKAGGRPNSPGGPLSLAAAYRAASSSNLPAGQSEADREGRRPRTGSTRTRPRRSSAPRATTRTGARIPAAPKVSNLIFYTALD
ncbi:hypothetical protein NQ318_020157 [Aromia moschata]|uniref:BTB domain-containing protein n=1 Tax=Aromia moschata TaxID=1265417 RepID=A0AAV8ZBB2_9CUCU|nr:hypothetical protein NQ318_020157 [Aromia moschata]